MDNKKEETSMGSQEFGGSNKEQLEKLKGLLDQMNTSTSMCSYVQQGDISKSQLVKTNTRKCVLNKWHMVLGLNLVTNDTLNLPVLVVVGWSTL